MKRLNVKDTAGEIRGRNCRKCGADYWYQMKWYNGPGWRCGPCSSMFRKAWKAKNKDKYRNWSWRERGIDMTVERYRDMEAAQNHACGVCKKPTERMVVDHDHCTGQTRALLCRRCNVLAQDPEILRQMLQYIESFRQ